MERQLRTTAKQKAYEYVKSRIIDRTFKEGDFLTEVAIANDLGMSRTPVREAFLLLEAENLVQLMPKKGAFVPRISPREIREVMSARALVETFAAPMVVEARSEIVPKLRDSLEEQRRLLDDEKFDEFVEVDREFHYLIVSTGGNGLLTRFYAGLRDKQIVMGIRAATHSAERIKQVMEEHTAIADAAEEGDVEQLKSAIREHLDHTLSVLMEEAFA